MATDRPTPEGIDYDLQGGGEVMDDCVHEAESGPHAHRALRFLAGVNLTLLAGLLGIALAVQLTGLTDAASYWRQSKANEFEWARCETKHGMLLRRIQHEQLWARLGMPGSPELR